MSERLRIATIFTNLHIGGDENRVLSFGKCMDRSRADHFVVCLVKPGHDEENCGPIFQRYQDAGIEVVDLGEPTRGSRRGGGLQRIGSLAGDARALLRIRRKLSRLFRERGVNVVDGRMNHAITMGAIAGRKIGVPVIAGTEYFKDFWVNRCSKWQREFTFRNIDCLISDSEQAIDEIQEPLPAAVARTMMIPNGIPAPATRFQDKMEARAHLGLPTDPSLKFVGQVSRMLPHKGHRVLIDAAARVLEGFPQAFFVITGYNHGQRDYQEALEKQARDLGIRDRIAWVSYPGPVGDVFAALDIHAHATFVDSAPIAIHEGMAMGMPIVAAKVWGIAYQVDHGTTGFLVPPNDPERFSEALLKLLQDDALRERFGAAARERHQRSFRPEIMMKSHLDLWDEMLDQARSGGRSAAGRKVPRNGETG